MRTLIPCPVMLALALEVPAPSQDVVPVGVGDEPERPTTLHFKPRLSFGYGLIRYREGSFDLAPGLDSDFEEKVCHGAVSWDFILGHHAFSIETEYLQSLTGTETWDENGIRVQENDLGIWRFGLDVAYTGSTWDRSLPPSALEDASRWVRFAGGVGAYYRHQEFSRDDFIIFDPPSTVGSEVTETFDMFGGEIRLELEIGPRDVIAAFARGRAGGGYVRVVNEIDTSAGIDTFGVQGTVEAGLVSQPLTHIELRAGFRYLRMDVFSEEVASGDYILELPDNTTELLEGFLEVGIPF